MRHISLKRAIVVLAAAMVIKGYSQDSLFMSPSNDEPQVTNLQNPEQESFLTYCKNLTANYIADLTEVGEQMVMKISYAKKRGSQYKRQIFKMLGLPMNSYCVRFGLTMQANVQKQDSIFEHFAYFNPELASCIDIKKEFFSISKNCDLRPPKKQNVLEFLKKANPYTFYRVLVDSRYSNSGLHYVTVVAKLDENKQQIYHADGTPQFLVIAGNGEHFCDAEKFFVGRYTRGLIEQSYEIVNKKISQAVEKGEIRPSDIREYNRRCSEQETIKPFEDNISAIDTDKSFLEQYLQNSAKQSTFALSLPDDQPTQQAKNKFPLLSLVFAEQQKKGRS